MQQNRMDTVGLICETDKKYDYNLSSIIEELISKNSTIIETKLSSWNGQYIINPEDKTPKRWNKYIESQYNSPDLENKILLLTQDNSLTRELVTLEELVLPLDVITLHTNETDIIIGYELPAIDEAYVSLKQLFQQEKDNAKVINQQQLQEIGILVLRILLKLKKRGITPGMIDLDSILIHINDKNKGIKIINIENFQLLQYPETYEWYPSDSKLFESDFLMFDAQTQILADKKLIYKILTANHKGNAKIPPNIDSKNISYSLWRMLKEPWKQCFLNMDKITFIQEDMLKQLKEDNVEILKNKNNAPDRIEIYVCTVILRDSLKTPIKVSEALYLLLEQIEEMKEIECYQGFVYGNQSILVRDFKYYETGFRWQLENKVKDYSFGEALIISCDLLEEQLKNQLKKGEKGQASLILILDGEIRNDNLFQYALKRMEQLVEWYHIKIICHTIDHSTGEGLRNLRKICIERDLILEGIGLADL